MPPCDGTRALLQPSGGRNPGYSTREEDQLLAQVVILNGWEEGRRAKWQKVNKVVFYRLARAKKQECHFRGLLHNNPSLV